MSREVERREEEESRWKRKGKRYVERRGEGKKRDEGGERRDRGKRKREGEWVKRGLHEQTRQNEWVRGESQRYPDERQGNVQCKGDQKTYANKPKREKGRFT